MKYPIGKNPNSRNGFQKGHKCLPGWGFQKGHKTNLGRKWSEETKIKMKISALKRKKTHQQIERQRRTLTTRYALSEIRVWNKGIKTGIVPKTAFKKGQTPWNFNNYSSFEPYGKEFNREYKEFIRSIYQNICFNCGVKQGDYKKRFDVHHIDYNKKNNKLNNLIPLCVHCHRITYTNRDYWTKKFNNAVKSYYEGGKLLLKGNV